MKKSPVIGIDLGTTNSEVAVCVDGKIEIIQVDGNKLVPSYVGLTPDNNLIVGAEARNQYLLYPDKTVKSIKRKMGSTEKVKMGDNEYLPQEISAMILKKLKTMAETHLKCPITQAVITVPAQFSDSQRQATREAGELAGLEVLRIINEPTAACLAYENDATDKAKKVLAFDLGGGTFDVSLVTVEDDVVEVIASHGNNHLGGDDFDAILAKHIEAQLAETTTTELELDRLSKFRINRAAETCKIHLSDFTQSKVIEDNLKTTDGKINALDCEVSRQKFEILIEPLLKQTLQAVYQTLNDANLKITDIDEIVLVGGSTRSPIIHKLLEDELKLRPRQDVHPDLAVVYGAAVMGARLMGENHHQILIDITPYTFGVSCMGMLNNEMSPYRFVPVIKSGTPLPINHEELFYTMYEGQESVDVKIFQGEEEDARKNILIGQFLITDLDEDAPAHSEIILAMRLDLDGILRVTAREQATGKTKEVTVENALTKLTAEQIAESKRKIATMFAGEEDSATGFDDVDEIIDIKADANVPTTTYAQLKQRIKKMSANIDEQDGADIDELMEQLKNSKGDVQEQQQVIEEIEDILFFVEQQ